MKTLSSQKIFFFIVILTTILVSCSFPNQKPSTITPPPQPSKTPTITFSPTITLTSTPENHIIATPISSPLERVTKKPFGIKVSPGNSPVSPERFSGYHTGVDFEILPGEENIDVPIFAICTGSLLVKKQANGYGGMMVQQCTIGNQDVTVVYGHLKLASIEAAVGQKISAGEKIGILGKGYSSETDGERKHLHLGIHKGTAINTRGYISNPGELVNWIDVLEYLK